MKRLNFENVEGKRYLVTKGELKRLQNERSFNYVVIAITQKGAVVEFDKNEDFKKGV